MQMDPNDIKTYRQFYKDVSTRIPEVANVPSIINAIKKLSGKTDLQTIKRALSWGNGPTIKIVKDLKGSDGKKADGLYRWGSDEIQIDEKRVKDFEGGKGLGKTATGKLVYIVGVTLLHELTHWADAKDGVDDPIATDPTNEEGEEFERIVYGGHVQDV